MKFSLPCVARFAECDSNRWNPIVALLAGISCLACAFVSFSAQAGNGFTKIANDGRELGAEAPLGNGPEEWACTHDNATGLVWEVKTSDGGLRDGEHKYTWFNLDPSVGRGSAGFFGTNTCGGTLAAYQNHCNTTYYVAEVNATALCGYTDWRLPTPEEIRPLLMSGLPGEPSTFDPAFMPRTTASFFWTDRALVGIYLDSWYLNPLDEKGTCGGNPKESTFAVRAVRGGVARKPVLDIKSILRKPQQKGR